MSQEFIERLQGDLGHAPDKHPRIPAVWSISQSLNKWKIAIESGTWRYPQEGDNLFVRGKHVNREQWILTGLRLCFL